MKRGGLFGQGALAAAVAAALWAVPARGEVHDREIWDLQAVDAQGYATDTDVAVMGQHFTMDQVHFIGVVLNAPGDMMDPNHVGPDGKPHGAWQTYVQAVDEANQPKLGGIALFAAAAYYEDTGYAWPRYPTDFQHGDLVEVTGYCAFYNGKSNLNERHDPYYEFTVTHVTDGGGNVNIGPVVPWEIPSVADCNTFDATRATGGEKVQGQWVRLEGLTIADPENWALGGNVLVTDNGTDLVALRLGHSDDWFGGHCGDFDQFDPPAGRFSISCLFDQEDETAPYTDSYRLWPTAFHQIEIWGDADRDDDVDAVDLATLGLNWSPVATGKAWADGDFDGDGDVDAVDLAALGLNWHPAGGGTAPLPEPATLALVGAGLVMAAWRRRAA